MKITLAKAFIIRKRLINNIRKLDLQLREWYPWVKEGEDPEREGKTFDSVVGELLAMREKLMELNNKIDEANADSGRKILNEIEMKKNNISIFNAIAGNIRQFEEETRIMDPTVFNERTNSFGNVVYNKYVLTCTPNNKKDALKFYLDKVEKLTEEIQALEDELASVNATVFIEYDN